MSKEAIDVPGPRKRWTNRREEAFLVMLAATCHVGEACAAAGMAVSSAYYHRRVNADFAAAWRAALLTGYDRLEERLLHRAGAAAAEAADAPLDPDLAIRLMALHHARMRQGPRKPQNRVRRATEEETDAAILKHLAALDRRVKGKAAAALPAPDRPADD